MSDEKKSLIHLTPEELESLREQLLQSIYADIGRSIVRKVLWVFGAAALILFAWLNGKGHV